MIDPRRLRAVEDLAHPPASNAGLEIIQQTVHLELILTLFASVALLAAKPGPGVMTVAAKAARDGSRPVLYLLVGTNTAKLVLLFVMIFGFSVVERYLSAVQPVFKAAAAIMLIWVGISGFVQFEIAKPKVGAVQATEFLSNAATGFILTIGNPFDLIFFITLLPSLLDLTSIEITDFAIVGATVVAADTSVALSYAIPLVYSRALLSDRFLKRLNMAASAGMILTGLYVGFTAFTATEA